MLEGVRFVKRTKEKSSLCKGEFTGLDQGVWLYELYEGVWKRAKA